MHGGSEFHIITVGNSLISNLQKRTNNEPLKSAGMGDEIWSELINDPSFLNKVYSFLEENPQRMSAELNSFLKYCQKHNISPDTCEIYLSGTQTASNEIALRVIERFFRERLNCTVYDPPQFPGYFEKPVEMAVDEFIKGLTDILDRLIYIASKKKEEGYKVVFNPTGGFKAHVITCAFAGFLTGCKVYYIHEEFQDIIEFPPMFYLPRGKEMEVLKILSDKVPRSGVEFEKLLDKYPSEIERLEHYGLVDTERTDSEAYRIRITSKGLWAYRFLEEL